MFQSQRVIARRARAHTHTHTHTHTQTHSHTLAPDLLRNAVVQHLEDDAAHGFVPVHGPGKLIARLAALQRLQDLLLALARESEAQQVIHIHHLPQKDTSQASWIDQNKAETELTVRAL